MPLGLQAKLLHVLQDVQFFRWVAARSSRPKPPDRGDQQEPALRHGDGLLFFARTCLPLTWWRSRSRTPGAAEEIPVLVDYFMSLFCRQYNRTP